MCNIKKSLKKLNINTEKQFVMFERKVLNIKTHTWNYYKIKNGSEILIKGKLKGGRQFPILNINNN